MEIFESTAKDSKPLIVAVKNVVLDPTGVLDPRDRI